MLELSLVCIIVHDFSVKKRLTMFLSSSQNSSLKFLTAQLLHGVMPRTAVRTVCDAAYHVCLGSKTSSPRTTYSRQGWNCGINIQRTTVINRLGRFEFENIPGMYEVSV